MKNNICPECGMPRIDCGNKGIKTINEIALEKKVERLQEQLKEAEEAIKFYANTDQLTEEEKQMTSEKYHLVYGLKAYEYLEKWGIKKF